MVTPFPLPLSGPVNLSSRFGRRNGCFAASRTRSATVIHRDSLVPPVPGPSLRASTSLLSHIRMSRLLNKSKEDIWAYIEGGP